MGELDDIIENFEFLDDWEDRYKYLIELGNGLSPIDEDAHNAQNKVNGCVSQVWLVSEISADGQSILFKGDSDAHIVRGLVAICLAIYSGKSPSEIIELDAEPVFARLGLQEHITPQRSNGLRAMVGRIKEIAKNSM